MIREAGDVSFHVFTRSECVILRLNKVNLSMSRTEALLLADSLVDAVELTDDPT